MKNYSTAAISSRRSALGFLTALVLLGLATRGAGFGAELAHAAPPAITSEVNQTPPGGSAVPLGTQVTYTANITLTVAQSSAITIQLSSVSGINYTNLTCTSSGGGVPMIGIGGSPSCEFAGPFGAGAHFTYTLTGTVTGPVGDPIPSSGSVVCNTPTNSCTGIVDATPLSDANGDVGPLTIWSGAAANSEVNQTPAGGAAVALGSTVTYTANVSLSAGQAGSFTIQLKGDSNIGSRTLNCSAVGNGAPAAIVPSGNPACRWAGPVNAGTFTFTFSGMVNGPIGDAVPNSASLFCIDANNNASCEDEAAGAKVPLNDANGDVGPLTIQGAGTAPAVSATEVNQTPVGGSTVALNTHVTYTANVTLTANQPQSLTIQLRGDANLINRSLACSSVGNAGTPIIVSSGNPSCRWAGPVNAGTFTFTLAGDLSGSIGDAVPDTASVVCTDTNNAGGCDDEAAGAKVALTDANGDVGPLTVLVSAPVVTSEVNQTPAGGTTVAAGTHITYTAQLILTTAQTTPLTIQLRGDSHIINRTLSCTSSTNGNANATGAMGNPSCMWNGPLVTGAFFFTFAGDLNGSIGDAVPDAASVACVDTNSSNSCDDEVAGAKVPLSDVTGDVGPVTVTGGAAQYRLVVTVVAADGITP